MFKRTLEIDLEKWLNKAGRKPLIIRGARQVGKTTLVHEFSKKFPQYVYLNLELPDDKLPFTQFTDIETLLQSIFFLKDKLISKKKETLLFIDEIQAVPSALMTLRYLFEQEPDLPVIAAGSMLESLFNKNIHFPVGRVEYKILRPVSFPEFLLAMEETAAYNALREIPIPEYAHIKLLRMYHQYSIVGGMPAVVDDYVKHKDFTRLSEIYDALIASFLEDVEKYAESQNQISHIRHAIRSSFLEAGKRIKFAGFGKSDYRSKEMGEALRTIERALLIHLIYPITSAILPIAPDHRKSPRLQILDTGMLNNFLGIQKDIIGTDDLQNVYKGLMIEHLTGQEILATQSQVLSSLNFWVREKSTSTAEVDLIFRHDTRLVPIEVKSGKVGKLKSLHAYMDTAPHDVAIRFYSNHFHQTTVTTANGKNYHLLHLPYYLASQMERYLEWYLSAKN